MQYGASIPPKSMIDNRPQFFTKQGFAHYMAQALQTVGMKPVSTNSYDLADPANAERDPGGYEDAHFFFDYPTNDVFTPGGGVVDSVPYRPMLGLSNSFYYSFDSNTAFIGTPVAYYTGHNVGFRHFRRRADRCVVDDFTSMKRLANYNDQSVGNYGLGHYYSEMGNGAFGEGGAWTGFDAWKLFASWANSNMQSLLFVNHIFVYLGPAGLFVQVGTHPTRRAQTANILNFAAVFSGGRIPNRTYAIGHDPLRDTIDPVIWLDLGSFTTSDYYSLSVCVSEYGNPDLTSCALGAGSIVNGIFIKNDAPIITRIRSIDYKDDSVVYNSPEDVFPRPSPTVINGNAVEALHRACMFPYQVAQGPTNPFTYVGRIDSAIQPNNNPIVRWEDTFYLAGFALGDRVMTPGLKTDPNTGKPWYGIWSAPRGQSFGIDYTSCTQGSLPTAGATVPVLIESIPLDMSALAQIIPPYSRNVSRNEALIPGLPTTAVPGTFGPGVTLKLGQFEFSNLDSPVVYTKGNLTNEFLLNQYGWTSWDGTKDFSLILDIGGLVSGADGRYFYTLTFDYFSHCNSDNPGDPQSAYYFEQQIYVGAGNFGDKSNLTAGAVAAGLYIVNNNGAPSYPNVYDTYHNYGALGASYPPGAFDLTRSTDRFSADSSGRAFIQFQQFVNYGDPAVKITTGIKNIVLHRYQYGP
jgi:hypothetical protein